MFRAVQSVDDEPVTIGVIPIDCSFNPVRRVSYKVEDARVGQQTDHDKLIMNIETNGVVSPEDALAYSAKILQDQLSLFINFDDIPMQKVKKMKKVQNGTHISSVKLMN